MHDSRALENILKSKVSIQGRSSGYGVSSGTRRFLFGKDGPNRDQIILINEDKNGVATLQDCAPAGNEKTVVSADQHDETVLREPQFDD